MSLDKNLHLRRRKDNVEVITLEEDRFRKPSKAHPWTPVRYVASGRKGYIKDDALECDFVVIGKARPNQRWSDKGRAALASTTHEGASALEIMRERDIVAVRKRMLMVQAPAPAKNAQLSDLSPSVNAIAALDQAIHMILAQV